MKTIRVFSKELIVCVSLLSLFSLPTFSFGATFCVSNSTELQSALTTAQSNGEDDTIKIVQGTYNGNFVYASTQANSLTVEGGYISGCASRTIDPTNTILDGGGSYLNSSKGNVTLTNNTLTSNTAETEWGGVWLKLKDSSDTGNLYNNIIWNNIAPEGADLYIDNTSDDPFFPVTVNLFNNDFDQSATGALT